eukprot:756023-Hanusia_phi.AAC.9
MAVGAGAISLPSDRPLLASLPHFLLPLLPEPSSPMYPCCTDLGPAAPTCTSLEETNSGKEAEHMGVEPEGSISERAKERKPSSKKSSERFPTHCSFSRRNSLLSSEKLMGRGCEQASTCFCSSCAVARLAFVDVLSQESFQVARRRRGIAHA